LGVLIGVFKRTERHQAMVDKTQYPAPHLLCPR
jgi:hypothetical protein